MTFFRHLLNRFSHGTIASVMACLVALSGIVTGADAWVYAAIAAFVGFAHRAATWLTNATDRLGNFKTSVDRFLHTVSGVVPAGFASVITTVETTFDPIVAGVLAIITYLHHLADSASHASFPNHRLTPSKRQ